MSNGVTCYYTVTATNSAGTSGNSSQDSATPVNLQSVVNVAVGGTASDSAGNATNAGNAFDHNSATQWFHPSTTGWLRYDLGRARAVERYTVTSSFDKVARDPKDWQFQGSNDGATWTTLDV
ncbi:discoidin domain-containing protein [Paracidovorax cattleyae]|uniref:discoidin domain-containing protein n=1 Tax=Paracidovorax cattleyae TaxID=80868 RepID=UPI003369D166